MRSKWINRVLSVALLFTTLSASVSYTFTTAYAEEAGASTQQSAQSGVSWPEAPEISAGNGILIDADTGAILYEKNAYTKCYPASTTKILTGLLTVENCSMDETVSFSRAAANSVTWEDSNLATKVGEQYTVEQALYGLLLYSANEIAYGLAEHVGGSLENFVEMMNARARELGAVNTHFANASGLYDPNHYTTAYDMALIGAAVYQKEAFRTISQTLTHQIPATNLVNEVRTVNQKHKMLWPQNANYYEYCKGGKTGYTDQARTTLVTMADNGEMQLVAVVLYDFGSDAYKDTREIFDYGFNNFSKIMLKDQEKADGVKEYKDEENVYVVLPSDVKFSDLKAEVKSKDGSVNEGTVTYTYEGQIMGKADVTLDNKKLAEKSAITKGTDKTAITTDTKEKESRPLVLMAVIAVVSVIVAAVVLWIKYKQTRGRKHRRKRRGRKRKKLD